MFNEKGQFLFVVTKIP
jgi:BlaI family penicillinase repressor